MVAVDAIVVCFQSTPNFPSWTSRVRSPSPALLLSVSCLALVEFIPRKALLNDVGMMLGRCKSLGRRQYRVLECQRDALAYRSPGTTGTLETRQLIPPKFLWALPVAKC